MGSVISSIFGGGYEAPDPVEYDPVPVRESTDPESKAVRESERRKLKARRAMSGTLLTSPLGTTGGNSGSSGGSGGSSAASGLLGRV